MAYLTQSDVVQDIAGARADSPDFFYRQRIEQLLNPIRIDHRESVRFFQITGEFRQELVGRNSDADGQSSGHLRNPVLNLSCQGNGSFEQAQ